MLRSRILFCLAALIWIGKAKSECTCGVSPVGECEISSSNQDYYDYIVGGYNVNDNWFPWLVTVMIVKPGMNLKKGPFICGGSIISPQHVLTAAHCSADSSSIRVHVIRLEDMEKSSGK